MPRTGLMRDERGSSAVEFVLVGALLTALALAVVQLALGVYVRNIVHDAAVEGAYHAALADATPAAGAARAALVIERAVGPAYAHDVTADLVDGPGGTTVVVTVRAVLPLIGLLGPAHGLEVAAHAPVESMG